MKDIFSDLYDRVLSFFTTQNSDDTKVTAKSRLRTVLMQDRVGFSERAMQMLKDDLIESISRYLEIEEDSFDLSIDATESATVLNLSIPVLRTGTDEEIDEALCIQEKKKIEKTQEIVGELKELVKEKAQELAEQLTDEAKDEEENTENEAEEVSEEEDKKEEKKKSK
ncbi:cell division topological specificity factor MinE [bacterium]|nr:cell division topological specificity factor MinE [bacterium]